MVSLTEIIDLSKDDIKLTLLIFSFWVSLFYFLFYMPNYFPPDVNDKITVVKGETFSALTDSLYNRKIISNKKLFRIAAFIVGADKNIRAGSYRIENGKNYFELLQIFTEKKSAGQKLVTIPEGIWQNKLASLLQTELNIDSAKFMELSYSKDLLRRIGVSANSVEGYLLPETYYFYTNSTEEEIIMRLASETDKIFSDSANIMQMKKLKMNRHQILTLASIIDGESNKISEFKRIAGVYYNRLRIRMPLQADPTIQYLKRDTNKKNKILYSDLEIKSPFNTYKFYGLPPAPINNPGKDAIMAALFPEKNNFLYFVADGSGGHVFSSNSSQHQKNVAAYRAWRRLQKQ